MKISDACKRRPSTRVLLLVTLLGLVAVSPAAARHDPNPYSFNYFSFGSVKKNENNGTATLTVIVPAPGTLSLTGNGVVKQRPAGLASRANKVVNAAGKVKLRIKAKGSKKAKLNATGKVKVKAKVTFTPTGGAPNTESKWITLKKD